MPNNANICDFEDALLSIVAFGIFNILKGVNDHFPFEWFHVATHVHKLQIVIKDAIDITNKYLGIMSKYIALSHDRGFSANNPSASSKYC
jgi:hypothetical protein